jgi:hypothetical protein
VINEGLAALHGKVERRISAARFPFSRALPEELGDDPDAADYEADAVKHFESLTRDNLLNRVFVDWVIRNPEPDEWDDQGYLALAQELLAIWANGRQPKQLSSLSR